MVQYGRQPMMTYQSNTSSIIQHLVHDISLSFYHLHDLTNKGHLMSRDVIHHVKRSILTWLISLSSSRKMSEEIVAACIIADVTGNTDWFWLALRVCSTWIHRSYVHMNTPHLFLRWQDVWRSDSIRLLQISTSRGRHSVAGATGRLGTSRAYFPAKKIYNINSPDIHLLRYSKKPHALDVQYVVGHTSKVHRIVPHCSVNTKIETNRISTRHVIINVIIHSVFTITITIVKITFLYTTRTSFLVTYNIEDSCVIYKIMCKVATRIQTRWDLSCL